MSGIDIDNGLLWHMTASVGSAKKLLATGCQAVLVQGEKQRKAFEMVAQQVTAHNTIPTALDLEAVFGVEIVATGIAPEWFITEAIRRHDHLHFSAKVKDAWDALKENDTDAARLAIAEAKAGALYEMGGMEGPVSLFSLIPAVKAKYEEDEVAGIKVPFPFPSLNKMTGGMPPGTNTWFLARPAAGKSWIVIAIALHVWGFYKTLEQEQGTKPLRTLIISPEMDRLSIMERAAAMLTKIGYGDLVGTKLGPFGKAQYFEGLDLYTNEQGVWVLDARAGITPEKIERAVIDLEIDVLAIDAVYRVRWVERPKDRFESMNVGIMKISEWAKREWPGGRRISVVASSQLARGGEAALSDMIEWESDAMFHMDRQEDEEGAQTKSTARVLSPKKIRRQAGDQHKVTVDLNMVSMNFIEIPTVEPKKKQGGKKTWKENF